jgi:hypothetical protein
MWFGLVDSIRDFGETYGLHLQSRGVPCYAPADCSCETPSCENWDVKKIVWLSCYRPCRVFVNVRWRGFDDEMIEYSLSITRLCSNEFIYNIPIEW